MISSNACWCAKIHQCSTGNDFELGSMIKRHFTTWTILFAFLTAGVTGLPTWCFGGDGHVQMGDVSCCLESENQSDSHCPTAAENAPRDDGCGCIHVPVLAVGPNSIFARVDHASTPTYESAITASDSWASLTPNVSFGGLLRRPPFVSSSNPAPLRTVILLI